MGLDEGKHGFIEDVESVWAWRRRQGQMHRSKTRSGAGGPPPRPRQEGEALFADLGKKRQVGTEAGVRLDA